MSSFRGMMGGVSRQATDRLECCFVRLLISPSGKWFGDEIRRYRALSGRCSGRFVGRLADPALRAGLRNHGPLARRACGLCRSGRMQGSDPVGVVWWARKADGDLLRGGGLAVSLGVNILAAGFRRDISCIGARMAESRREIAWIGARMAESRRKISWI